MAGGFVEQLLVDVETDLPRRSTLLHDRGERDPADEPMRRRGVVVAPGRGGRVLVLR